MSKLLIGTVGSPAMLSGDMTARKSLIDRVTESEIDHLFIADHISFHTGLGMDGLINAATLAAMAPTTTIVIGVYLLALRHPVPVARQLSSLSMSAPGRIVLGVGVGGEDRHEMEICGVDPAKRGRQTNHALAALRGGKDVYCEKPLANSVEEANLVRKIYLRNEKRLATQMGTQIHASDNYRRMTEMIRGGAIGVGSVIGVVSRIPHDVPERSFGFGGGAKLR